MDKNKRGGSGGVIMVMVVVIMLIVLSWIPVTSSFIVTPFTGRDRQLNLLTQPPSPSTLPFLSPLQPHHQQQQRRRRRRRTVSAGEESSSLCLYGVRSRISQTFSRWRRTISDNDSSSSSIPTLNPPSDTLLRANENKNTTTDMSSFSSINSSSLQTLTTAATLDSPDAPGGGGGEKNNLRQQYAATGSVTSPIMTTTATTATMTLVKQEDDDEEEATTTSLYTLPPVNRSSMTSLELEFRDMLEHFTNYTQHDILSLRDANMRTLIEGIAASAHDQAVYRAFEVLFEDLYPLRVAGRVIYNRLVDLMDKSNQERNAQVQAVVETTGMTYTDVDAARLLFVAAASTLNHGPYITLDQLQTTGLVETARNVLTYESADRLLKLMDPNNTGRVQFTDFILGLQQAAQEQCAIEHCNPIQTLHEIVTDLKDNPPNTYVEVDVRRQRFIQRYDEMHHAFVQWQDLLPTEQQQQQGSSMPSRRWDVIHGCFVGAENEKVVAALRICYVEYSGLRLAAEIIFKLVSAFMNGRQRAQNQQRRS